MSISVVVPVFNEEKAIGHLCEFLITQKQKERISEIIIVDGGSSDKTLEVIKKYSQNIIVVDGIKGRARQMNVGAQKAAQEILYFLHVDSFPEASVFEEIKDVFEQQEVVSAVSPVIFSPWHWTFYLSKKMSQLKTISARFGDQGLFIKKDIFEQIGGFNEELLLFEDQEIFRRIIQEGEYIITKSTIQTSSRRFFEKGIYKVHVVYYILNMLYQFGVSQEKLMKLYKKVL